MRYLFIAAFIASLSWFSSSSYALDCEKAKAPIDVAICSDGALKAKDAELSKDYFTALRSLKASGFLRDDGKNLHDLLLAYQRAWLKQRDKKCSAEDTPEEIKMCLTKAFDTRRSDLIFKWGGDGDEVNSAGLMIGREHLSLIELEDGRKVLKYRDKIIVESPQPDSNPAFSVIQRWTDPYADAVLLETGTVATLECSTSYIVETQKAGSISALELGENCVGLETNSYKRTETGFVLATPVAPARNGEATEWNAYTDKITTREVWFHPETGTNMRGLLSRPQPEQQEPLRNEEFFESLTIVPEADRTRFLKALWQVANGCSGCGGNAEQELYGVFIAPGLAAYSGLAELQQ